MVLYDTCHKADNAVKYDMELLNDHATYAKMQQELTWTR